MKKKRKNKKSLTAIGTVVAAGLSPGIVSGSPVPQSPGTDVELTAADAVSINGDVLDFDELYALQQINHRRQAPVYGPPQPKVYGPRPPKEKDNDNDKKEQQEDWREQARQDSIRLAMEKQEHALVYGPPPPTYRGVGPEELRSIAANDKQEAANVVLEALMDYCAEMPLDPNVTGHIILSENSDLVRELAMRHTQLESLQQEIENRFGIQLTEDMLKQLGTLRRIANFIAEVAAPIQDE